MTRGALAFSSHFKNNSLYVVNALADGDLQSARRLGEDIKTLTELARPGYCEYRRVHTASELGSVLEEVVDRASRGLKPIIHIDAHGDDARGIQIGSTGEFIPWETLIRVFSRINKLTRNNLGVVLPGCNGLHVLKPLHIYEPTPFYFLVGSQTEVSAGFVEDRMPLFYKRLLEDESLDSAMEVLEDQLKQFHAEKFFYTVFAMHMKRACIGAGGAKRVEDLVTKALNGGKLSRNRANMRMLRKKAKQFVRFPEPRLEKFAQTFLHGGQPVNYEVLRRFARGEL